MLIEFLNSTLMEQLFDSFEAFEMAHEALKVGESYAVAHRTI